MSQRWGFYATMDGAKLEQCDDGELVKYDDHEAALAEKDAEIERLKKALDQATNGMSMDHHPAVVGDPGLPDTPANTFVKSHRPFFENIRNIPELAAYLKEKGQ